MNNETSNIADLLKQLRDDTTKLVRSEIALAKAEVSEKASVLSRKAVYVGVGALLGYAALTPLLFAFGYLLRDLYISWGASNGTGTFLGLLTVALITGGISACIIAKGLAERLGLAPEKTIQSLKENKDWVQNKLP